MRSKLAPRRLTAMGMAPGTPPNCGIWPYGALIMGFAAAASGVTSNPDLRRRRRAGERDLEPDRLAQNQQRKTNHREPRCAQTTRMRTCCENDAGTATCCAGDSRFGACFGAGDGCGFGCGFGYGGGGDYDASCCVSVSVSAIPNACWTVGGVGLGCHFCCGCDASFAVAHQLLLPRVRGPVGHWLLHWKQSPELELSRCLPPTSWSSTQASSPLAYMCE